MFNDMYRYGGMYNPMQFMDTRGVFDMGQFSPLGGSAAQGLSGLGTMKSIPPWVGQAGKFYMQNPKMVNSMLKSGKDVFFNNGNVFGGRGYTDVNVEKNINVDNGVGGFCGFGGITSLLIGGIAGYALANAGGQGGGYPASYPQPVPMPYPAPYPNPQGQMPYPGNQPYVANPNSVPNMQGPVPTMNQGGGQTAFKPAYAAYPYPAGIQMNQGVPYMQGQQINQGVPYMPSQQMNQGIPYMQGQQMNQGMPSTQSQPQNLAPTQHPEAVVQNPAYKEYHTYEVYQNGEKSFAKSYQYPYPYYDTNK